MYYYAIWSWKTKLTAYCVFLLKQYCKQTCSSSVASKLVQASLLYAWALEWRKR